MKYSPVIVVVAYNRPDSLKRILTSLTNAKNIYNVKLIISIDNSEPENDDVRQIALDYSWPFGEKQVIYQEKKLGLRKHILQCGDLTREYGSVIILEDDLFVSPYFYNFTVEALEFYDPDEKIGGISLYSQPINDINDKPFNALADDSDVYFLQFPSSWGQAWTEKHWQPFRQWLEHHSDISDIPIHKHVLSWSQSSWKKYFVAYLQDTKKFFVFPRLSFTTNFNDPGTHRLMNRDFDGQAQLAMADKSFRFKHLSESFCLYDSHFELFPESVVRFAPKLKSYPFETDLYGLKDLNRIDKPFVLTSRSVRKYEHGFARALKPHDMNIVFNLEGHELFLSAREDVLPKQNQAARELSDFQYFYSSLMIGKKAFLLDYLSTHKPFSYFFN
jgi:hypothetical protein